MFNQKWSTNYDGHKIDIKNAWFGATELYIDDKLYDKSVALFSTKLIGKIKNKDKDKELKTIISASMFSVECIIFVDDEIIYSSKNK